MGIVARHCLGGGPATARTASQPLQNPRRTTTLGVRHFMKKVLCLIAALTLALSSLGCTKIRARMEIKAANEAYQKEDYAGALPHYQKARQIDPSFPDLDRLVGYSEIGLYVPDDKSAKNEQHADRAILELNNYLKKRPDDRIARDALINMYLNANRTSHAIEMKPDYAEAMAYLNLLWRQQALVDAITNPVKAQADVAQADAIRNKTMQIFAARKAAGTKKM